MEDRNIEYGEGITIHWTDFINFISKTNIEDMGSLLNGKWIIKDDAGEEKVIDSFSVIARSIIKLQSLGVLQSDFLTYLGTTSSTCIDRFHLTVFGQKLLEYIDINEDLKPKIKIGKLDDQCSIVTMERAE